MNGAVSECAFGPHAALAKKPEMLMYNMYTPLSELCAALPADQIHHSDPPPGGCVRMRLWPACGVGEKT